MFFSFYILAGVKFRIGQMKMISGRIVSKHTQGLVVDSIHPVLVNIQINLLFCHLIQGSWI
jgi:hypothetical protein